MDLLGHVIRAPNDDSLRQVTFKKGTLTPQLEEKRRTGRPKNNWILENLQLAWFKCKENSNLRERYPVLRWEDKFNYNTEVHCQILREAAADYII